MKINNLIYQYLELLKKQGRLSIKTINAYSTDLKQFVKLTDNSDLLNKTTILDYISYLNDNYKERTVKRKIASVKAFFSFLLYEEFIDFNSFSKIKIKFKKVSILPRTISIKDLNTLFQYLYNKKKSSKIKSYEYSYTIRNIAILELLLGTGIRVAELCNLKKHDVMISETKIRVLGKGKKERILPIIHTSILKALTEYEEYFFNKEENFDFYFINKYKQKLSEQSIRNIISKVSKACQIQTHITPHMFRHTFATLLLDNNVDILYIQKLLGHSSIQTTQIYTHVNSKKFFEIMKDKNPRLNLTFDLDNNELSKEAVKVYHTKADTDLFLDKDIAKLTKLVAEVEAFIASLKKEATPAGTAEYGKVYMDVAGADKDVYEALDKADTGALQLAKKALKDHDKLEESTTKLQEKFDAAKAEADFIAPELKDTVTFKRSQVTVDATNVKVENLATGEKVFFHKDNSAINVMLGDAPGAEAVNGEFKATEDHFVIVKVDKDGKVVSFKRYTKAADLVNKVGKKAEATTLTLKDATNNSLTVGNKDLKTETIVNATGYVLDTTDQVQFEVDPGTATVKYMTEVVSGDVLKNAEFAAPEAKELVSKDNVKLMATGVFKMTITVTQEDADNGNYIPTEYVVTVTVQP